MEWIHRFSTDFFVATFFITAKPYLLFYGFFILSQCSVKMAVMNSQKQFIRKALDNFFLSFHWTLIIYRPSFKIQRVWRWLSFFEVRLSLKRGVEGFNAKSSQIQVECLYKCWIHVNEETPGEALNGKVTLSVLCVKSEPNDEDINKY